MYVRSSSTIWRSVTGIQFGSMFHIASRPQQAQDTNVLLLVHTDHSFTYYSCSFRKSPEEDSSGIQVVTVMCCLLP